MNSFRIKTDIFFGQNSLDKLKEIKNKRILIVTDAFMVESGIINKITDRLKDCEISVLDEVKPDPGIEIVTKGIEKVIEVKPEIMIALGGGSPIDAAKAIKELIKKMGTYEDFELIAIPTTSGTGSEVTKYSVITNEDTETKHPLVSEDMIPDIAILDPELVVSAPQSITADTGMDVITHAIEAYVAEEATDFTDALVEKSLKIAFEYLPKSYKNGNDIIAREKMHNASCMAGLAFNKSALGLNHGIAHALGGKFNISHGRINAMLLPLVIGFNADLDISSVGNYNKSAQKYNNIAKLLDLPTQNASMGVNNLIHEINSLNRSMKIPRNLTEAGISKTDIIDSEEDLVNAVLADICTATNPRQATAEDVRQIIRKLI